MSHDRRNSLHEIADAAALAGSSAPARAEPATPAEKLAILADLKSEVDRRAEVMQAQVPSTGTIPGMLVARPELHEVRDGACGSCGELLQARESFRCELCNCAARQVLRVGMPQPGHEERADATRRAILYGAEPRVTAGSSSQSLDADDPGESHEGPRCAEVIGTDRGAR